MSVYLIFSLLFSLLFPLFFFFFSFLFPLFLPSFFIIQLHKHEKKAWSSAGFLLLQMACMRASVQKLVGTIGTWTSGPQVIILSVRDWSIPSSSIIPIPMMTPYLKSPYSGGATSNVAVKVLLWLKWGSRTFVTVMEREVSIFPVVVGSLTVFVGAIRINVRLLPT